MRSFLKLLVLIPLLAGIRSVQAAEPLRVFIRAGVKTHGPNQHDHPRFLAEWTKLLAERGMTVDGGMDFPTADQLEKSDVLIIYAQDGMNIVGDQRANLEKFLRRGGGLVVIHDGVVSGNQYEWCKSIIGGAWRSAGPDMPAAKATKFREGLVGINWVDHDHPISRHISNFDWKDEIYADMDLAPDIGVLASSFFTVHNIAPQLWTYEKTLPGGTAPYRAFVSLPGHEYDVFNTPHYRAVLMRGIAWAGKRDNADEYCSKEELGSLVYPVGGPLRAQDEIKTFNLHPDFNISLVADENIVEKLISLDWDPKGRLWVVETPEYPNGRAINRNDLIIAPWRVRDPKDYPIGGVEPRKARDRISILEDPNSDGVMQKKTVFADGLELATSLVLYKDGVIISQAPETLFAHDTTGSGKANKVDVLFKGWGTGDTHAVTSNLRWGPDGWVYGAVGYSSGDITSGDGKTSFGHISAGLYRFRPNGSALEQVALSSCNTWGCEIAPDGEIFYSTATCGEPILHVVLPEKVIALAGMPGVRGVKPIISENKVYPARHETRPEYQQIDWVGAFTAAAGACIYDGGAWPGKWEGPPWAFFVEEPTVWLMHQDFLYPDGVSYQGRREPGREHTHFLTSTDYWFKPVHTRVGPDGALYLVDMYNQIAVHNDTRGPAHGAHNAATRPDRNHHFTRLFRIQHKDAQALPPFDLDVNHPANLVEMLDHPNGWVRTTANRLLSQGAGLAAVDALHEKAAHAKTTYGRMQALWVLHNLKLLQPEELAGAIRDPDAVIRKNALQIVSEQDDSSFNPSMETVRSLLADPNQRVRIWALIAFETLTPDANFADALTEAWPTFDEPHLQAAALAVTVRDPLLFLKSAMAAKDPASVAGLIPHLARQVAQKNSPEAARAFVVALAAEPPSADDLKASALQSFRAHLGPDFIPTPDPDLIAAVQKLLSAEKTAGAILPLAGDWHLGSQIGAAGQETVKNLEVKLADKSLSDDERGQIAVELVGVRSLDSGIIPSVSALVGSDAGPALQRRVMEALGATGDPAVGQTLLAALPNLSFDLREIAFGQLIRRADWSEAVIQALADHKLNPDVLGLVNLSRLRTHADDAVAKHATEVMAALRGPQQKEKDAIIARLRPEIIQPGNVENGAKTFAQICAACHSFKGKGATLAPKLDGMGAHGREELLIHVIDPNRMVEPNFYAVSVETKDDLDYDGIVVRDNAKELVLKNQTGEISIRKDNIRSRRNSNRSLMPEGFEQLGAGTLRDLLAYLCADEQRYRIIDLAAACTADTDRGIYTTLESREESIRFKKWGIVRQHEVPFDVVNPQREPDGKNVIVLKGGLGMSQSYPKEVTVKVGLPVTRLHFLGGVAGWGYPNGKSGEPAAKITVHYAGGGSEDIVLRNGVEIADYISHVDVPGSEALENEDQLLQQGRQLRYFSKALSKPGMVESLTISSYDNDIAPTFAAITAEVGNDSAALGGSASSATPVFKWGPGIKTLIIGGGSSHDFQRWFNKEDVKTLDEAGGISANYTETTGGLADVIAGVDVLIICNNKPFTDTATKDAIFRHLENGKGIIGLHPGLWYNWKDWPEYNRTLIGGGAHGHNRYGPFEVTVLEPNHPLMRFLPGKFTLKDELYHYEIDPQGSHVEVLATAHSEQDNKDYPQVFTVEQPKGRVVGITLGHDGATHQSPEYVQLLRNAVFWAAGMDPKKVAPN